MKVKQYIALSLLGMTVMGSLRAGEPTAWQRKSVDQLQKEANQTDKSTFASSLSPLAKKQFDGFTPAQRKMAMDYADKNKMSPDDAVSKVASMQ